MVRIISLLLLVPAASWAQLSPQQSQALDQYITERSRAPQMTPVAIAQMTQGLEKRLEELENKILPISVLLNRAMQDLKKRAEEIDFRMTEVQSGKYNVNPYEDANWKTIAVKDAKKLCCEIKADPARQRRIQAWAAKGGVPVFLRDPSKDGDDDGTGGRMYRKLRRSGDYGGGGPSFYLERANKAANSGDGGGAAGRGGRGGAGAGSGGGRRRGR